MLELLRFAHSSLLGILKVVFLICNTLECPEAPTLLGALGAVQTNSERQPIREDSQKWEKGSIITKMIMLLSFS